LLVDFRLAKRHLDPLEVPCGQQNAGGLHEDRRGFAGVQVIEMPYRVERMAGRRSRTLGPPRTATWVACTARRICSGSASVALSPKASVSVPVRWPFL